MNKSILIASLLTLSLFSCANKPTPVVKDLYHYQYIYNAKKDLEHPIDKIECSYNKDDLLIEEKSLMGTDYHNTYKYDKYHNITEIWSNEASIDDKYTVYEYKYDQKGRFTNTVTKYGPSLDSLKEYKKSIFTYDDKNLTSKEDRYYLSGEQEWYLGYIVITQYDKNDLITSVTQLDPNNNAGLVDKLYYDKYNCLTTTETYYVEDGTATDLYEKSTTTYLNNLSYRPLLTTREIYDKDKGGTYTTKYGYDKKKRLISFDNYRGELDHPTTWYECYRFEY